MKRLNVAAIRTDRDHGDFTILINHRHKMQGRGARYDSEEYSRQKALKQNVIPSAKD